MIIYGRADVSYQFTLLEGEHLDVSVESQNGSVDVLIFDSNNYFKYIGATPNAEIYEPDAFYENVIAKKMQFIAPADGDWYVIIENNNGFDVSIDVKHDAR